MGERAFPSEPQMHERDIRPGETAYDFYTHSGLEHIIAYRKHVERWLANYPLQHQPALLRRLQSKKSDAHESAFFELFLHEYLRKLCDHVEVEGELPDSNKRADYVLHFEDGSAVAVEALSIQRKMGLVNENVRRVNEYIQEVKSSDFFIWLRESQGSLKQTPSKKEVQNWTRRVLTQLSWEKANEHAQHSGDRLIPVEPLKLKGWRVAADIYVKDVDDRTDREYSHITVEPGVTYYEVPRAVRDKVLSKIRAKKSTPTTIPFVLAVNVTDRMWKPSEEELEVLYGYKHRPQITRIERADGTKHYRSQGLFSPDGTEGVWSTVQNKAQYGRCSAVWFFHQVDAARPRGTRQALYLNPHTDHGLRLQFLQHYATAGIGFPE